MINLDQIKVSDMTEADKKWLEKGCEGAWDKATAEDQLNAVATNSAWLFRLTGDVEGILVLARGNIARREITITAVAGKGFIRNFPAVYGQIRELVRKSGSKQLSGFVTREGLIALYKNRTRAKPVATLFVEELK